MGGDCRERFLSLIHILRFADTDGAIAVRVSRLYGTRKMAEESLLKKLTVAVRQLSLIHI